MVNLNNVNVPVHIGSRGIRRGKSSRQLRGIKRNKKVTFKENSIVDDRVQDSIVVSDDRVQDSIVVSDDRDGQLVVHTASQNSSPNEFEQQVVRLQENVEEGFSNLDSGIVEVARLLGSENTNTSQLTRATDVLKRNPFGFDQDVRDKLLRVFQNVLDNRDNVNISLNQLHILSSEETCENKIRELNDEIKSLREQIQSPLNCQSSESNQNSQNSQGSESQRVEIKRLEREISNLRQNNSTNQNTSELKDRIEELEKLIKPGSKEEQLKKCTDELKRYIDKHGVLGVDMSKEFDVKDNKRLADITIISNIVAQAVSTDEALDILASTDNNKEEIMVAHIEGKLKSTYTDITKLEIKEALLRVSDKWVDLRQDQFLKKSEDLQGLIGDAKKNSPLDKLSQSFEGILTENKDKIKEIYDMIIPFIPLDSDFIRPIKFTTQLSLYIFQLQKTNPDVNLEILYKFSDLLFRNLTSFGFSQNIVKPSLEIFRSRQEFKKFMDSIGTNKSILIFLSTLYTIVRQMELQKVSNDLKNQKTNFETDETWKLLFPQFRDNVRKHFRGMSLNDFGVTIRDRESVLVNPIQDDFDKMVTFIKTNLLKDLNPPSEINIRYGETDGVFDFVKKKLRKPDAIAPPKTKQEFDEQQVEVSDTSSQEQENDTVLEDRRNATDGEIRAPRRKLSKRLLNQNIIGSRIPAINGTRPSPPANNAPPDLLAGIRERTAVPPRKSAPPDLLAGIRERTAIPPRTAAPPDLLSEIANRPPRPPQGLLSAISSRRVE